MYEYLIWIGILAIGWLVVYALFPRVRRKLWWSSWLAMPFGIGEIFFIPEYWTPQTLFNLGLQYRVDIESFALMFFLGGLASGVYEAIVKQRLRVKGACCAKHCLCYTPLLFAIAGLAIFARAFPELNIIYVSSIACLMGVAWAFLIHAQLRKHLLFGGIAFAAIYLISLALTDAIAPGWIAATWNMAALSGITALRVPIEELLFGLSFGMLWTALYEEVCENFHVR